MMHPDTEQRFINGQIGYGVFATAFIPRGTIVYVKDDLEVIIPPTHTIMKNAKIRARVDKYSYIDENGNHIISWDHGKYVNHCCNCNTMSTGYGFEIAIRDIQIGEEVTDEYGIFNLPQSMKLICDKPNCRGIVKPEDFDTYYQQWDKVIKEAILEVTKVDQPLIALVDDHSHNELIAFLEDHSEYKSVYSQKLQNTEPIPHRK